MRETTMRRLLPAHKIILLLSAFGLALALVVYVNGSEVYRVFLPAYFLPLPPDL